MATLSVTRTHTATASQVDAGASPQTRADAQPQDPADSSLRLVIEDPYTGEKVVLADGVPWRALEVLGEAGVFYKNRYAHADWPQQTVDARRGWAGHLGGLLWDAAVDRVGPPNGAEDLPPL